MENIKFRPLGDRYLVLPDQIEAQKEQVGDYSIEKPPDPNKVATSGTVVSCGSKTAELVSGDRVIYGQYAGYDHDINGTKYKVLRESEILGQLL